MYVIESLDVEAGLTRLVFSKLAHEVSVAFETGHDVKGQVLLAGRESGQEPIPLPAAGIFVVIAPETDDARSPHLGPGLRGLRHQIAYHQAVFAFPLIRDAVEKLVDTAVAHLGLEFGQCLLLGGRLSRMFLAGSAPIIASRSGSDRGRRSRTRERNG